MRLNRKHWIVGIFIISLLAGDFLLLLHRKAGAKSFLSSKGQEAQALLSDRMIQLRNELAAVYPDSILVQERFWDINRASYERDSFVRAFQMSISERMPLKAYLMRF